MATVPAEITFTAGSILTAAQLNTNVRDAVNFLTGPPIAVLRQVTPQTFTNNAWTSITYDTVDIDRDGGHSNAVNPSRYTAQTAGWFLIQATCSWTANATGGRQLSFAINGGNKFAKIMQLGTSAFVGSGSTVGTAYLNVGDYVESFSYQNSGGGLLAVVDTESGPRFQLLWTSS